VLSVFSVSYLETFHLHAETLFSCMVLALDLLQLLLGFLAVLNEEQIGLLKVGIHLQGSQFTHKINFKPPDASSIQLNCNSTRGSCSLTSCMWCPATAGTFAINTSITVGFFAHFCQQCKAHSDSRKAGDITKSAGWMRNALALPEYRKVTNNRFYLQELLRVCEVKLVWNGFY